MSSPKIPLNVSWRMNLTKEAFERLTSEVAVFEKMFKVKPKPYPSTYRESQQLDAGYKYDLPFERWMAESYYLNRQRLNVIAQEKLAKKMRRDLDQQL